MSQPFVQRFTITSNLERPADTWTADFVGASAYREASEKDRITLEAGYFTEEGEAVTVPVIVDGIVDLYDLRIERDKIVGSMQGRCAMALLLDTQFRMIYRNGPSPETIAGASSVPEKNGLFTASQIAADIVDSLGLDLSWEAPNYTINDQVSMIGRPFDLLKTLARPFNLVPARLTDIFVRGRTVVVRQRPWLPTADPLNTFPIPVPGRPMPDVKVITSFSARRFRNDRIGRVTLTGMKIPETVAAPPELTAGTTLVNRGTWAALTDYVAGQYVAPTLATNTRRYLCVLSPGVTGTSDATEPTWPTGGIRVQDGTVLWTDATAVIQQAGG